MNKTVSPTIIQPDKDTSKMKWVEKISRLLDSRYKIPGTSIRFGWDPIFSFVPVVGDMITYIVSGVLIYTMYQHGASRKLVIKMILNSSLDAVIGSIPLIGTVFDIFYKSNERNVKLLKEHYYEGRHTGSGTSLLWLIGISILIVSIAILIGLWLLISYLAEVIRGL